MNHIGQLNSFLDAAVRLHKAGFNVIPVVPGTKRAAEKWEWNKHLSELAISEHWHDHPDHELGCILGDRLFVLDADGPESVRGIERLQDAHGIHSNFISKTSRGKHFYYQLAPGAFAKTCAY